MDAVVGGEQGDLQAGLLDELGRQDHVCWRGVQDGPDVKVADQAGHVLPRIQLQHLADLFGQRHALDQVVDALLDGQRRVLVRQVGQAGLHARQSILKPLSGHGHPLRRAGVQSRNSGGAGGGAGRSSIHASSRV